LIYEDVSDNKGKPYEISRLKLNGKSLYGRPDLVLRNKTTKDIMIVEIKHSRLPDENIPLDGWLNLQAQLWCYAFIDEWKDAPNIYLIGNIIQNKFGTIVESGIYPRWKIRKNGKLNMESNSVKILHEKCLKLFQIYGGEFEG